MPTAPSVASEDALALLRTDHRLIKQLIAEQALVSDGVEGDSLASDRHGLLARLGVLLRTHARIEDELFYPALRQHAAAAQVEQSMAEHADIATLLEALAEADPLGADYGPRMARLADLVQAHFDEEERTLFAAAAELDLQALGRQLALRRAALMSDLSVD